MWLDAPGTRQDAAPDNYEPYPDKAVISHAGAYTNGFALFQNSEQLVGKKCLRLQRMDAPEAMLFSLVWGRQLKSADLIRRRTAGQITPSSSLRNQNFLRTLHALDCATNA